MSSQNIARKLISGGFLRTVNLAAQIAVSFYMMPFLVHSFGDRLYGFWTLVATFIGYYGLLDLGFSSAVSRYVSRAMGRDDTGDVNRVLSTAIVIFAIIGTAVLCLTIAAVFVAPLFLSDAVEKLLFRKLLFILGLSLAVGFPMRVFGGILTAKLRYDLTAYVEISKLLVRSGLVIWFVKQGSGLLALATITLLVDLCGYLASYILAKKELPDLAIDLSLFTRTKVRTLFGYSVFTFIAQIADILRFRVDGFVIAGFLNVGLVTHYTIASRLLAYFVMLITNTVGTMAPVFSQYEGRGDFESIRKHFLSATRISVILSVFVGSSILIYGKPFIARWMGIGYEDSSLVLSILTLPTIIALMQNPGIGLLYGISKHRFYAFANTGEGILNLVLSLILVRYFGIFGVAFGTAMAMLIFKVFIQPAYTCRAIGLPLFSYYKLTILTLMKTAAPLGLYFLMVRSSLLPDYSKIFVYAALQCALFLPVAMLFVVDKNEKRILRNAFGLSSNRVKTTNI